MFRISLIFLLIAFAQAADRLNTQLVNKNIERSIDLASQLVKITATITIENTGKEPTRNFHIVLEPNTLIKLSYINVKDALKNDLKFNRVDVENHQEKAFYSVQLRQPLEAGKTTILTLEQTFSKHLEPYPSSITQKEKQLVRYFGNHYFYTPYQTVKQTTNVILSSRSVENYSKLKPTTQTDSTITYGPYTSVAPFQLDQMIVHYENNAPFLTVTRLERIIEISHWGNIAVEENIEIRHTGAKLKGPFSRYDYQRDTSTTHHSIKSYRTILPAAAHSIYYRDSNGNISTSTVRPRKEWIELELRPRFPLFGGWQSSYILGYSVPSYQYLYRKQNGDYVLNMRLLDHVFDDMHVDELETSIVLPVGVPVVKINPPYEVERLKDAVSYKYLDNIGRTVIKLRKTNLVEQHIQDVEIVYNWKPHLLLHEPILLSIVMYFMFVFVIIYVRLDFSLSKGDHLKKD